MNRNYYVNFFFLFWSLIDWRTSSVCNVIKYFSSSMKFHSFFFSSLDCVALKLEGANQFHYGLRHWMKCMTGKDGNIKINNRMHEMIVEMAPIGASASSFHSRVFVFFTNLFVHFFLFFRFTISPFTSYKRYCAN